VPPEVQESSAGISSAPNADRRMSWVDAVRRRRPLADPDDTLAVDVGIPPFWDPFSADNREAEGSPAALRRDAQLRRSLALVDVVSAFLALVVATELIDPGVVSLRPATALVGPFVVLASKLIGLYDRDQDVLSKSTIEEVPSLVYLAVVYALATWLGEALVLHGRLARAQVFALLLAMFLLTACGRWAVRRTSLAITPMERCIVLGDAQNATRVSARLEAAHSVNATVIGRIALSDVQVTGDSPAEVPKLGEYGDLAEILNAQDVERVIIAPGSDGQDQILDAIRLVKVLGVKVSVVPRLLEVVGSSSTVDEVDGIWLLGVRRPGLARSSKLLKRAVDLTAAGLGLVLLSPVFAILTVAVKVSGPGPVFFRQPRVGRRGERFWMLKFRSMVDGADAMKSEMRDLNEVEGGLFKIANDPRVTGVGQFLRRTSLDELPQLFNVLRGDMSLVGPRPLEPDEDALIEGWQRGRLAVKPGMTGLWQIFGSSRVPMSEMVKIDYVYGANWSLWLDLRILLRTIPYMFGRRGL
jgi:exopolysaccharide biosynthesis polyprenyl glycosylphosphotransferase